MPVSPRARTSPFPKQRASSANLLRHGLPRARRAGLRADGKFCRGFGQVVRAAACEAPSANRASICMELAARAVELMTEFAKHSGERSRSAACKALLAGCDVVWPELAARACELVAEFAMDLVTFVRSAAR